MAIERRPSAPQLPLDIFEIIIERLAAGSDVSAIKALCLTNSSLLSFCRKQIFRSLVIKARKWGEDPFQESVAVCLSRPSIAPYIQELKLWVNLYDDHSLYSASYLLASRYLKNVHSFSLAFEEEISYAGSPVRKDFSDMSEQFKLGLYKFLVVNPIKRLELWQINDIPVRLFTRLPELKELMLYNVGLAQLPLPKVLRKRPACVPQLRQLCLQRNFGSALNTILNQRIPVLDISRLEDLSVLIEDEYGKIPTSSLFSASQALRKLSIAGSSTTLGMIRNFAERLSPQAMDMLKTLEFSVTLDIWGQDPFVDIIDEVSSLSGRNRLETLLISLTVDWDVRCSVSPDTWNRLERVLLPNESFPSLKRVHLDVTIIQYLSCDYLEFQGQLEDIGKARFSKLSQKVDWDFKVDVLHVEQAVDY